MRTISPFWEQLLSTRGHVTPSTQAQPDLPGLHPTLETLLAPMTSGDRGKVDANDGYDPKGFAGAVDLSPRPMRRSRRGSCLTRIPKVTNFGAFAETSAKQVDFSVPNEWTQRRMPS